MISSFKLLRLVVLLAAILALFVVMLGAYTRLTDAGLGCPDWPGCYGHIVLPLAKQQQLQAQLAYPNMPIEARKAWTEMIHRYFAGCLAFLMALMALFLTRAYQAGRNLPWGIPFLLVCLVTFQAILGMWTVTLKLLPIVVMGHLLGGILIATGLWYFSLQLSQIPSQSLFNWRMAINVGFVLVFLQIALGGWVSANYAGVACIGFPRCNGVWLPSLHLYQAFNLCSPLSANYQGGVLDNEIRVTIQFIHRLGACVVASYVVIFSSLLYCKQKQGYLRCAAVTSILLVLTQLSLGILNVVFLLPLPVAVAHNGVALLLLINMAVLHYLTKGTKHYVREY